MQDVDDAEVAISIHALREESDEGLSEVVAFDVDFNPRSP